MMLSEVCVSPDGNTLVIAGSGGVQFWDVAAGMEPTFSFDLHGQYCATLNHDGSILACWDQISLEDEIFLWDVPNRQLQKTLKHSEVTNVCFSPTESKHKIPFVSKGSGNIYGSTLASGSDDGTVKLWNVNTSKVGHIFTGHLGNSNICFSPDGSVLADIGSDNTTIRLWNVHTGQPLKILNKGYDAPWGSILAFSPDKGTLASVAMDENGKHNIQLWNIFTERCRKILKTNNDSIRSIAFSSDGRILASGNEDGSIRLWKIRIPILLRPFLRSKGIR